MSIRSKNLTTLAFMLLVAVLLTLAIETPTPTGVATLDYDGSARFLTYDPECPGHTDYMPYSMCIHTVPNEEGVPMVVCEAD